MRYELADYEWFAIKPMLPNKPPFDSEVCKRGCSTMMRTSESGH
jgi:hypothetical protein